MKQLILLILTLTCFLHIKSNSLTYEHTKHILSFGPRPAASPTQPRDGLKKTRDYIVKTLKNLNFTITLNTFEQKTPFGKTNFTNIIADYKQQVGKKKLILSAHYESKYYKDIEFLGATDSACPCGMLLELASFIDKQIQSRNWRNPSVDVQLIFFDGEEAMVQFNHNDGLYGSKHLASKWEKKEILRNIEMLILFDLLGHKNPNFYSYRLHRLTGTVPKYNKLMQIERQFNQSKFFKDLTIPWDLTDDHIPFGERGVPVLHLISNPYPSQWHTDKDNLEIINDETIKILMKIFKEFLNSMINISN
eukprot:gene11023-3729_t